MNSNHRLKDHIPRVREIFKRFAWESEFGKDEVRTFDDFEALVDELCRVDEDSYAFRYPVDKKSFRESFPDTSPLTCGTLLGKWTMP